MPVYLFSLGISPNFTESRLIWSFLIIHLLLYPASNGYNSYFDKDEKSIGGLKNPPPVNTGLYYMSLLFDGLAVILGLKISLLFSAMLLIYGLVSKAYSHPIIRLKKYPVLGWLVTGFFQGFFTFLMCYVGINGYSVENLLKAPILLPAVLSSIILWASYPMTQVYQHDEDKKHGDKTLSIALGIKGTFYFSAVAFGIAAIGFLMFFNEFYNLWYGQIFLLALAPVVIFFLVWFFRVHSNLELANYENTMWLNLISATCLNAFFIYFFLESSQILQAIRAGY